MDFGDCVSWLVKLSSPTEFKSAKSEFIEFHEDGYCTVDEQKGVIEGVERNPQTGEFEEYTTSFDQHILTHIEPFLANPVAQILAPIPASKTKVQFEKWLENLSVAKSYVDDAPYYSNFPGYKSSLSKLIATLKDLKRRHAAPSSPRKYKQEKARNLEPYLDIIENAGSHEEAIKKLEEEVPEFSWEPGRKELFQKHKKKMIGTNVSVALEKIAKIKWPDDYPLDETIRTAFFK
jgi:hypothetical protein